MAEPWERQSGESPRRFAAFQVYRDAGPGRSLRTCARQCSKSVGLVCRWSAQDGWQNRVLLWDARQDELKRQAMADEIQRMAKRQADMAVMFESKVLDRLRAQFVDPVTGDMGAERDLSLADAARIFDIATRVERSARGVVPAMNTVNRPAMTDQQIRDLDLAELDALQAALRLSARSGDTQSIALSVKIMERRAQLLGLDAPQQLTHRGDLVISEVIIERPVDAGAGQDSPDPAQSPMGGAAE